MDGVGISIIGRPRPLPGHDTPNPANNTYTLNYEEPFNNALDVHTAGFCSVKVSCSTWKRVPRAESR